MQPEVAYRSLLCSRGLLCVAQIYFLPKWLQGVEQWQQPDSQDLTPVGIIGGALFSLPRVVPSPVEA